jgi:predicted GNAT family acetyltransferase
MNEITSQKVDSNAPEIVEFLTIHSSEIETYFPHFEIEDSYYSSAYILKDNAKIIGVFIYQSKGEELHVDLDFVISEFRDKGIGADFFKNKINEFRNYGFTMIVALTSNEKHIRYLNECAFKKSSMHPDRYELSLI